MDNKKMKKGTNKENVGKSQQSSSMTGPNATALPNSKSSTSKICAARPPYITPKSHNIFNQNRQPMESSLPRPIFGALNPLQPPNLKHIHYGHTKNFVKDVKYSSASAGSSTNEKANVISKSVKINTNSNSTMAHVSNPITTKAVATLTTKMMTLTVDLAKTYRMIDDKFYQIKDEKDEKKKPIDRDRFDPSMEEYIGVVLCKENYFIKVGKIWNGYYCIMGFIGAGTFGQVLQAQDLLTGDIVAIKIISDDSILATNAANLEIKMYLDTFQEQYIDLLGASKIVRFLNHFKRHSHVCMVFERLDCNLREFITQNNLMGLSLDMISHISQQVCQGLRFLSLIGIIHCDIKMENIMLCGSPIQPSTRLVDFGSSCRSNQPIVNFNVQSHVYRAPELLLHLEYSHPIDIWSLGCIMIELYIRRPLFVTQSSQELMLRIIELFGMPPSWMMNYSRIWYRYFDQYPPDDEDDVFAEYTYQPKVYNTQIRRNIVFRGISRMKLKDLIMLYTGGLKDLNINKTAHYMEDFDTFIDLIHRMLIVDPIIRIKPENALQHPFFISLPSSSSLQAIGNQS